MAQSLALLAQRDKYFRSIHTNGYRTGKKTIDRGVGDIFVVRVAGNVANVWQAIEDVFRTSPITVDRVKSGKLKVEGALYDIDTGFVTWMGPDPKQDKLLSEASWPPRVPESQKRLRRYKVQRSERDTRRLSIPFILVLRSTVPPLR